MRRYPARMTTPPKKTAKKTAKKSPAKPVKTPAPRDVNVQAKSLMDRIAERTERP